MKSLSAFKKRRTALEKQFTNAINVCDRFEKQYGKCPTADALKELRKVCAKVEKIRMNLGAVVEMIGHYDFYKSCWEEEQHQAYMARLYQSYNI